MVGVSALGSWGPWLFLGVAFHPSGFWFKAILGAGFGGFAALGWGYGAVPECV